MSDPTTLVDIAVPDTGFEDHPVRVGLWLVNEGEKVSVGDRLVELQCPGLLVPVTAPTDGVLTRIEQRGGQSTSVGATLGKIAVSGKPYAT